MISPKKQSTGALTPNYFLRKVECYGCDAKRHRLFLKESENYLELLCKGCKEKKKKKDVIKKMTKKDDEECMYCCICIIVMTVIGILITYWYITIPVVLIILAGYIIYYFLEQQQQNYKYNTKEQVKREIYVPPRPEYPPNCVNCNMPIKTVEDLKRIDKKLYCSYCGCIRLKIDELYEIEMRKIYDTSNKKKETRTRHISAQVKREVWQRDYGKCVECDSKELLEYDHIIPFSKGGSNTVRNIQLLCEKCNRKKYDKI